MGWTPARTLLSAFIALVLGFYALAALFQGHIAGLEVRHPLSDHFQIHLPHPLHLRSFTARCSPTRGASAKIHTIAGMRLSGLDAGLLCRALR